MFRKFARMQSNLNIQRNLNRGKYSECQNREIQPKSVSLGYCKTTKVKEELYLFKREETAISLAATEPNARLLMMQEIRISPKKNIIYLGLLMGLLIPFGVIYTDDLLDTKIKSRLDFEGKQRFRLLGFTNVRYTFGNNETKQDQFCRSFANHKRPIWSLC
jgi:hypothetical protein